MKGLLCQLQLFCDYLCAARIHCNDCRYYQMLLKNSFQWEPSSPKELQIDVYVIGKHTSMPTENISILGIWLILVPSDLSQDSNGITVTGCSILRAYRTSLEYRREWGGTAPPISPLTPPTSMTMRPMTSTWAATKQTTLPRTTICCRAREPRWHSEKSWRTTLRWDEEFEQLLPQDVYRMSPGQYLPSHSVSTSEIPPEYEDCSQDPSSVSCVVPQRNNMARLSDYRRPISDISQDALSMSMYTSTNASCSDVSGMCEPDSEVNLSDNEDFDDHLANLQASTDV